MTRRFARTRTTGARRLGGFTLVELLLVVLISTVLLALGVPAWQDLVTRTRVAHWQRQLHAGLNFTRHHAVTSARSTVICARGADGGCAAGRGHWQKGWLVFEDPQHRGDCQPGPQGRACQATGAPILRVHDGARDLDIVTNSNIARRVRYNPMGLSYGYTGRFTVCSEAADGPARGLVIANTGRVRPARAGELLDCPRRSHAGE